MATTPVPPSSSLPQPLSYENLLGNALSSYAASIGVNDLNTGSAMTSFFQVSSLMAARASGDIFQVLRDFSLDRATGPALQNLALEYNVPPIGAKVATSFITVTDLSFQKISSKIYAGLNPPIAGSTTIYVSDASLFPVPVFPAVGYVYLGRGSTNIEKVSYSAKTQIGSYWSLTTAPTTRFHNVSESVILAQGGVRTIPVNTTVVSPGVGTTADVKYSVTQVGTILDGETVAINIPITAQLPGISGNVPANAISQFSGNPPGLSNASVTNPLAVSTGKETETDDQLRVRVKNKLASTGLGTVVAIQSALAGVQDPNSSATIVSTDILNSSSNTIVYVDDGSGYEATNSGVAIETIVNSALGGERFFQLVTGGKQTSVTKAFLQTVAASPYNLSGGEALVVVVGNVTYTHSFLSTAFANPGSATAYEVCASINADTLLNFEAVTSGGGNYVVIRPIDEKNNSIQVVVPPLAVPPTTDSNSFLQFPSQKAETLRLYKNGILLTQDGSTASIFTQPQPWSPTLADGVTFGLSVDGTAPITYVLTNAMFVAEGTYSTLSSSNSLQSWVNVLNTNITGITASIVGSQIEITSNLGPVNRAEITVVSTSLPSLTNEGVISINDLSSKGIKSDYILDRNTAQIQLDTALVKGDVLSAGTPITQANIKAATVSSGAVALASDAHIWISIDINATIIPTVKRGSTLAVSKIAPNIVRYTSNSVSAFSNVVAGDYVIVWSAEVPSGDALEGRVHAVTGSTLDIEITAAEWAIATAGSAVAFIQGFVVVRTQNVPQKFEIASGTKSLFAIAAELQAQTNELTFGVFNNTNITVTTNTDDPTGQITVVTADAGGIQIGFVGGTNSISQDPLIAFYDTQATASELPLFLHSTISTDSYADPIDSYLTSFSSTLPLTSFDPNELITFLNPYGISPQVSGAATQLATAANFAIIAASAITNTGSSTINGNVGVSPSGSITPGAWTVSGTTHTNDATATTAKSDAQATFTAMQTLGLAGTTIPSALDAQTLVPGAYKFASGAATLATSSAGTLTLNGAGTYIIYTGSTLTTGAGGLPTITLENGALATNVYWIIGSSATINSGTAGVFNGNIIAQTSITDTMGGTVNGTLVALTGAVTLSAAAIINSSAALPSGGTLTLISGTGDATITASAYSMSVVPNQFIFTVTSANATAGAIYSNNGQFFTVSTTIAGGTTLTTIGSGLIDDEQPSAETVQMSTLSGPSDTSVVILPEYPDVRRLRVVDRFFVANPLDFGYNDTVVAIVDNNTIGETYTLPLYRRAIVNSTYALNNLSFNAYDVDAGATASFVTNFAPPLVPQFDFSNFKVLMQAKRVIQGSSAQTALLFKSTLWGRSGEQINVSYVYPTSANQPINSTITVDNSINVKISLISGAPFANSMDATTQWNVNVNSNTPTAGIDQVTYSWAGIYTFTLPTPVSATIGDVYKHITTDRTFTVNATINGGITLVATGTGRAPSLASGTLTKVSGSGSASINFSSFSFAGFGTNPFLTLSGGEYVTILPSTGFNVKDTGTFRVSTATGYAPTPSSFSVQVPTGSAVSGVAIVTGVLNGISFYAATPTTAAAINTYVNASLSKYITSTIVNDSGMIGSGILGLSTFEDSGFVTTSFYLKDGINWIQSSNIVGSPQFTLKKPLTYFTDTGYSFNAGDEVRLVPTTMDQVQRLWSIPAVTGFSIVGTVELVDRGTKLQLATTTLGSSGSIQIVGGSGNEYSVPVLTAGQLIGTNEMVVSANSIASQSMASDQWFRLQAQISQKKNTGISNNTSVTVVSNSPTGDSTITLLNRNPDQRYFGAPRAFTTVSGRIFRIEKQGSLVCLSWNGVGTSPNFGAAANLNDSGGWTVNISNTGVYTVASGSTSFSALSIGDLITITGAVNAVNNGTFFIESVNATSFGVSNPSAIAETGTAITAGEFSSNLSVSEGDTVILTAPFTPLNQGSYRVIRMNHDSIWYENPNAVEQEVLCTSNSQIKFYPYDATVPGDNLLVNGTVLGAGNAGTYKILQVVSPTQIIVSGLISSTISPPSINLANNSTNLAISEGVPYTGYKQVAYVTMQPGATNFNDIVFNTSAQYDKIGPSAMVAMVSLGKLNFPTSIRTGIDSYIYDTGLIGEANRTVFGDPRDSITYPGVSAAGTNCFIREPLLKRIKIALAIRTNIGVSFAQISNQIRSTVYGLILSNPLGTSIDLSSIVENVRMISGITSVVLTSPTYTVANDEIQLVVGEKAFIVDQVADISISLIGS